jgi:H+/Cl- antiporter ClcA/CBS domain-containing protein
MSSPESSGSTTEGLPVAPSFAPGLRAADVRPHSTALGVRSVFLSSVAVGIGLLAAAIAEGLTHLIHFFTQLSFYGHLSTAPASPANHALGVWVIAVPVVGAFVIGVMARFGSAAIRGHGIPEAMETVLSNESRIPPRVTFLKPLSAAISIGTGGPFGAEGPIIATGGALGSLIGQVLHITADERKVLLSAGAAAGMSATFGSPVSAVLLAVELLLFEYRPRSVIPVALASAAAAGARWAIHGAGPAFVIPTLPAPSGSALAAYAVLGAILGIASVGATRAIYAIEDAFEKLPIHWMWWPALGALAVGGVGYFAPRTLGVGYDNIEDILSGHLVGGALVTLCALKFVSWSIALGSGTSGGTLAPLLTVGGGLGAALAGAAATLLPGMGVDPRVGALVGMAAMFAGASRALLASVVFAFEVTQQPLGLLPLLAGCSVSFLVSSLLMRHSIMTEKIARRGRPVPSEYISDFLSQVPALEVAHREVVTLRSGLTLAEARAWLSSGAAGSQHQGFPVVDAQGSVRGMLTRRELLAETAADDTPIDRLVKKEPVLLREDESLRDAADLMAHADIGRLPVVGREAPHRLVGILSRSDLVGAHRHRLRQASEAKPTFPLPWGASRPARR